MPLGRRPQKQSRRGEKKTAEDIGGRRQPGSGNQWHSKADVKSRETLVERKDTNRATYTLAHAELVKLKLQSIKEDRDPVFLLAFNNLCGTSEYAVIPWQDYLDLKERAKS